MLMHCVFATSTASAAFTRRVDGFICLRARALCSAFLLFTEEDLCGLLSVYAWNDAANRFSGESLLCSSELSVQTLRRCDRIRSVE